MTAVVFWNLGVAAGLTGIFLGQSTSVELLEFPGYAAVMLWCSFALFAYWTILNYLGRRSDNDQIGQAWLLVGLFSFPWLYAAGSMLLGHPLPGSGVIQGMIDAWYVHGVYTLWLAPRRPRRALLSHPQGLRPAAPLRRQRAARVLGLARRRAVDRGARHGRRPVPRGHRHDRPHPERPHLPARRAHRHQPPRDLARRPAEAPRKRRAALPLALRAFFVVAGCCEQILSIRGFNVVLHFTMFREANGLLWIYGFFSFDHLRRVLLHPAAPARFRLALELPDQGPLLRQRLRHPARHRHARLRRHHAGHHAGKSRQAGDHPHRRPSRALLPDRRHALPLPHLHRQRRLRPAPGLDLPGMAARRLRAAWARIEKPDAPTVTESALDPAAVEEAHA